MAKKLIYKKSLNFSALQENLPLSIKISELNDAESEELQAELAAEQVERIRLWEQSLLRPANYFRCFVRPG